MISRRTKIIATYGPSTEGEIKLKKLLDAGMDAMRFNFSHGSQGEYARAIAAVRTMSMEAGKPVAIIADLQGPKIRIGEMPDGGVDLIKGQEVTLTSRRAEGTAELIPVSFNEIGKVLEKGSRVLLDDGRIYLRVLEDPKGGDVVCRVTSGGKLQSRNGVNFPGETIDMPSLSSKDLQDLDFAIQAGVDYVALSFVKVADDIEKLRGIISSKTDKPVKIIAKVERHEAIRNINSIIDAADAVMIARGDLGVEIAPERVPFWQKEIIARSLSRGRPVITATQMLETMIDSPVPTRAEASDVANAVYDGSDAIMLSGETAVGRYPVKAVVTMNRIARTVEATLKKRRVRRKPSDKSVTSAISITACDLSDFLEAKAVVTPTSSGKTALQVSKHRPAAPILALSSERDVVNQLALLWGVEPYLVPPARHTDDMFAKAVDIARKSGLADPGDVIVITAGVHVNVPGTTNLIKVHTIE